MGYDTKEEPLKKLQQLGFKIGDENARYEGVEIKKSSPFKLMRALAREYGYRPTKAMNAAAPGGRTCLMWTLIGGTAATEGGLEAIGIVADVKRESEGEYIIPTSTIFGLKMGDEDPRNDGVEVRGASPFKVMRILCSKYGWTTDGEVVSTEAPGGRTAAMWTLTRKVA